MDALPCRAVITAKLVGEEDLYSDVHGELILLVTGTILICFMHAIPEAAETNSPHRFHLMRIIDLVAY